MAGLIERLRALLNPAGSRAAGAGQEGTGLPQAGWRPEAEAAAAPAASPAASEAPVSEAASVTGAGPGSGPGPELGPGVTAGPPSPAQAMPETRAGLRRESLEEQIAGRLRLAARALDDLRDRLFGLDTWPRDRRAYDRQETLREALEAWRQNPLARRIVELTSQYVVGGGVGLECRHTRTNQFLNEWWHHHLNRMPIRTIEWCDELSRAGELFIVVSTDPAGMSYVRAIPAAEIQEIETAENDLEQEVTIYEKPNLAAAGESSLGPDGTARGRAWKVYNELEDGLNEDGAFTPVMLHYAINRPVGAKHGESDLAPLLRWLARYAAWLEDRARLNRYRNTFLFWVKARFGSQAERLARQAELNANPPNPGSILVTDESEQWSVLAPQLASFEANEDGLALKKMIAVGSGNPMHFLAEPEGATRTTAESAGGPTFRRYQQRQLYFLWMIEDLARVVLRRRRLVDRTIAANPQLKVTGTDISSRDNSALATAASTVIGAFAALRDRGLIDDAEFLRIAYRFAGEVADVEELLERAAAAPPGAGKPGPSGPGRPPGLDIDPITGEAERIDEP